MSWVSESGEHEGYFAVLLVDGAVSAASNGLGPIGGLVDDAGNRIGDKRQYSDDQVVGWQLRCDCRTSTSGQITDRWTGPTFTRAATPAMENLELRRLYADPGQATDAVDRDDVDELAVSIWRSEHVGPIEAVEEITRLRELIQTSTQQLDEAVGYARAAGTTWEVIGRAANMSRQSAHDRWGSSDAVKRAARDRVSERVGHLVAQPLDTYSPDDLRTVLSEPGLAAANEIVRETHRELSELDDL